jgi:HNH endonuclease
MAKTTPAVIPDAVLEQRVCARDGCETVFRVRRKYPQQRFCSRRCGFLAVNPPDHNARVARATAAKRGDMLRGRGAGKTYRKRGGRHEHRVVMEQKLGRRLTSEELIHHDDHTRGNNDPGNLLLTNRVEHARLHNTGRKQSIQTVRTRVEATARTKAARRHRA